MLNAIRAEWVKMWTVRTALVCTLLTLIAGIANGIIMGLLQGKSLELAGANVPAVSLFPTPYLVATLNFGVLMMLVLSALSVTQEYSTSTIESTFRAVPKRWRVFTAKLLVYALYSGAILLVTAILSMLVGKLALGSNMDMLHVMNKTAWDHYWRVAVTGMLIALFSLAMAMLTRRTAASIALTMVWMFAIEPILGSLPKYGKDILPFLPFQNLLRFSMKLNNGTIFVDYHWSSEMSALYFFGIAAVLWLLGLVVAAPNTFRPLPKAKARADVSAAPASRLQRVALPHYNQNAPQPDSSQSGNSQPGSSEERGEHEL